jgi:hypothetical protein
MIARAKAKKAALTELEFGRNVSQWHSFTLNRDDLVQYLCDNGDAYLTALDPDDDDDAKRMEVYADRVWASLCEEADYHGVVSMEDDDACDHEELDDNDDEFCDILSSHAADVAKVVLAEEEARQKAKEVAEVTVPVVPEKTRDELVAEVARLTAELEAIKEKMRNAMASLGY